MRHVAEHLAGGRTDVDLAGGDAERGHQGMRAGLGLLAGGEARQGKGEDVGARQRETVEGARGDDQRVRRIEATGDADHHALHADGAEPLL